MEKPSADEEKTFYSEMDMPQFGLSGAVYEDWMKYITGKIEELSEIETPEELDRLRPAFVADVKSYIETHLFTEEYREKSNPVITFSEQQAKAWSLNQTQFESRAEFYRQFILPMFTVVKSQFKVPPYLRSGVLRKFMVNLFFGKSLRMMDSMRVIIEGLESYLSTPLVLEPA